MKRYTAVFDRYNCLDNVLRLMFKELTIDGLKMTRHVFIEAMDAPFLVGELSYEEPISFLCEEIKDDNQIIQPTQIIYRGEKND